MAELLNTTITGTLSATGAVSFGSTLGVTGAITGASLAVAGAIAGASLGISGAATFGSTLGVTGAITGAALAVSGAVTAGSFNGLHVTPTTGTLTITTGKALATTNNLTFSGTDGSTLNIGTGGTLGSNAFTSTAYVPQTTTVAGHTLSGNITLAASDLSNGTTGTGAIVLKSYVDGLVTSPINLKGGINAAANPDYPTATIGDSYRVTAAGRIGGASGKVVSVGDMVVCFTTSATGNEAAVGANWNVSEANIPGITGTGSALLTAADAAAARAAISAETAGAAAAVAATLATFTAETVSVEAATAASLAGLTYAPTPAGTLYPVAGSRLELTSSGSYPYIYLPASANDGDEIYLRDGGVDFSNYALYLYLNGGGYLNGAWYGNAVFAARGATYRAVYGNWTFEQNGSSNWGWKVGRVMTEHDQTRDIFTLTSGQNWIYPRVNTTTMLNSGAYQTLNVWLPSEQTVGDEVVLIDGGWNFASYPMLLTSYDNINGSGNDLSINAQNASVRCVWTGGNTGWQVSVMSAGAGAGQYVDTPAGTLYPVAGNRLNLTYSGNYSYIYLPGSGNDGDEIYLRDGGVNFSSYGLGLYLNGGGYLNGAWYGSQWFYERGATYRAVYGYWTFGQSTNWGWKVDRVMTDRDPFHEVVSLTDNTSSFYPSANTTTMLTYSVPSGTVTAYLPSNYALGDEVIIIDGGRNFSAYALVVSSYNGINGVSGSPATLEINTRNALVRCVWTRGGTGWHASVESTGAGGDWTPTPAASIYPGAGDKLEITSSGNYPYIYLPNGGSQGDVVYVRDGGIDFSAGHNLNIYINGGGSYLNGSWGSSFYSYKKGATIRCEYGYWFLNGSSNYGWKVEEVYSEQLTLDNAPEAITNDSTQTLYPYAHETKILRGSGSPQYNVTAYLPSPAVEGNEVRLLDGGWDFSSHSLTVQAMSGNVNGSGSSATIATRHADVRCLFVGGSTGWLVTFTSP